MPRFDQIQDYDANSTRSRTLPCAVEALVVGEKKSFLVSRRQKKLLGVRMLTKSLSSILGPSWLITESWIFKDTFCATVEICVFYSLGVRCFESELGFGRSRHIL